MEDYDNIQPLIGFICNEDNADKKDDDSISFTIVRYAIPRTPPELHFVVTIESFSSETFEWTANKIILDVPMILCPCTIMISPSASVIDGVFCWYDDSSQITVYDSINKSFWAMRLPQHNMERGCGYLGSSDGGLYFALNIVYKAIVIVWYLASDIRNRDPSWIKKYERNVGRSILQCPDNDFEVEGKFYMIDYMVIHPTIPHIFYLGFRLNIISYDFEMDVVEFVSIFSGRSRLYKFFPFEWYQWPRRLE